MVYRWILPDGTEQPSATLDYTPPDNVSRIKLRFLARDANRAEPARDVHVSLPPAGLADLTDCVCVEAEDFVAQGGGEVNIYRDAINVSGTSLSHWNRSTNHWLEWQFAVPADGRYEIFLRYTTRLEGRRRNLTIDGKSPGPAYDDILFEKTGGWAIGQDTWAFRKLGPPVALTAGSHRLRMTCLNSAINVDCFVIARAK